MQPPSLLEGCMPSVRPRCCTLPPCFKKSAHPERTGTMPETIFRGRHAATIENADLRVTVLREGGHIAEVFDKRAGVSPLWIPLWNSVEPSVFDPEIHSQFGSGSDAKLLAGIMGHSLCLDLFGGPSAAEAAAGYSAHGEGSVSPCHISEDGQSLSVRMQLPLAQMSFTRLIDLRGARVRIREIVTNLAAFDRPIGWTQHVTLGPPFLDPLTTEFRASVQQSVVSEPDFGSDAYLSPGKIFTWPHASRPDGSVANLQRMHSQAPASGFTTHLADPAFEHASFVAFSPKHRLAFGYIWKRAEFPWLGIWEENCSRHASPWSCREITRGMEFGVSPFPESRREMVLRGKLFGVPTFGWIEANATLEAEYWICSQQTEIIP